MVLEGGEWFMRTWTMSSYPETQMGYFKIDESHGQPGRRIMSFIPFAKPSLLWEPTLPTSVMLRCGKSRGHVLQETVRRACGLWGTALRGPQNPRGHSPSLRPWLPKSVEYLPSSSCNVCLMSFWANMSCQMFTGSSTVCKLSLFIKVGPQSLGKNHPMDIKVTGGFL